MQSRKKKLPPHPNIVKMYTAFADFVPDIQGSMEQFPAALPRRLNPSGFGRNMSLFLVMKKYDMSLADYLHRFNGEISWKTSVVILTQLLEGIAILASNQVAHRDLKSDNILVDLGGDPAFPALVITDFGCCFADSNFGLKMPYHSAEMSRGGNVALMAPEVAGAKPGRFAVINYEKSDVWAAGTIAYEIFGYRNPFYPQKGQRRSTTNSLNYKRRSLPSIEAEGSITVVTSLVRGLLEREPKKRLSAEMAATICQLLLWAPRKWTNKEGSIPKSQEILQWALTLTTKIACESKFSNKGSALREYQLVSTFLSRFSAKRVKEAIQWIKEN